MQQILLTLGAGAPDYDDDDGALDGALDNNDDDDSSSYIGNPDSIVESDPELNDYVIDDTSGFESGKI